ncbi:uncharacterized protein [Aegilops tauschii subsp. strangulata]|uniref:uncharacterized protein n=1 Tax=Aegilops tauschii subsp. strangulata TaxID=200361 RepID=UPI003CC8DD79
MGRITEWALELSGYGLYFEHSDAIKSQALMDFTAEWTETAFDWGKSPSSLPGKEDPSSWTIYFDGSYTHGKAGAGAVLISPTGERLKYVVRVCYTDNITNNTAEYEGLLVGLRASLGLGISKIVVKGDFQLVIKQINEEKRTPKLTSYLG